MVFKYIQIKVQIDDISSAQTARICQALRSFPQQINTLSDRYSVWFSGIEQNTRVIKIQAFVKTDNLKSYRATWEQINLAILKLMEQEGIKLFTFTPITILPTSTELPEQIHQF